MGIDSFKSCDHFNIHVRQQGRKCPCFLRTTVFPEIPLCCKKGSGRDTDTVTVPVIIITSYSMISSSLNVYSCQVHSTLRISSLRKEVISIIVGTLWIQSYYRRTVETWLSKAMLGLAAIPITRESTPPVFLL